MPCPGLRRAARRRVADVEAQLSLVERTIFLMGLEYFRSVSSEIVSQLAIDGREDHFEPGEVIYDSDTPARRLYVIIEGKVELLSHGRVARVMERGQGFGLLGALHPDAALQLSCRALEHTHVLSVSRDDFLDLMQENPDLPIGLLGAITKDFLEASQENAKLRLQLEALTRERAEGAAGTKQERVRDD